MRLSPTGLIEISDEDVDKFKKFMKKESHSKRKFHLQHLRMGIDETDNEITIVDHHIIPRWLIREKLIDLCSTPNDTDLKNILESYLNDARNERLRKIIEIEITEQLSHGGQIIYMSFICNPKNLVFGPLRELRSHDRNGGIDLELLANADLVEKKLQLEDPHFSLIEKLLMISDLQHRGTSTWTRDPANNSKFEHREDLERIGKQVCHWYREGFDTPENPIKRVHLPTGTLV